MGRPGGSASEFSENYFTLLSAKFRLFGRLRRKNGNMEAKAKQKSIEEFRIHESDTGSADVQIALLTQRINSLT